MGSFLTLLVLFLAALILIPKEGFATYYKPIYKPHPIKKPPLYKPPLYKPKPPIYHKPPFKKPPYKKPPYGEYPPVEDNTHA
ncbi:hypothetical protein Fmac_011613 [Flemingia macrophylla]|uniref:Early nodulin-12A n=1 Tax=Flemingia macrophylla TaxID=520843 RepID=A0ABD1MMY8_9FABA